MAGEKAVLSDGLTQAQHTGRAGEDYAAGWLLRQGYRILARNWSCPGGEVDIIAAKGEIVAFVEVKSRRPGAMVSPEEAVGRAKRQRLLKTARAWLRAEACGLQPRMDVAAVTIETAQGWELVTGFAYYESAFDGRG